MIEEEFTSNDLYGLAVCLTDMDEMLARADEAVHDKAVRYAIVKTFELTYEIAVKTIRKYLIINSAKSDDALTYDFQDLIRLADAHGLVRSGWPEWKQYRANRSRTIHTYGGEIALQISAELQDFSQEIHPLLDTLRGKLEEDHG